MTGARALCLALLLLSLPAQSEEYRSVQVVDGDTLRIAGLGRVRVVGVDTPELRGQCERERELAQQAHTFTRRFLRGAVVEVVLLGKDRYSRYLARVSVEGRDLAEALIAAGLGRNCGPRRCNDWCIAKR